ncbi:hypothetical protein KFU94_65275 [Chloroflexi bacterium TSY]|nr:hypothetical protein [Chloroflexi bacterium TSY]
MDEVLDQQPEEMYDFLVKTSFLERMCAPLIEATIPDFDRAKAQLILEQLDATNLFIVPLDSERHWYRYHHLFAQLLRRRFQKTYAKSATGYHQRASQWYVDHNLVIDAVNHALRGKHFEFAANLIHKIWVGRGHQSVSQQQIFAWLRTLPVEIIHHQPRLAFHYVTAQYRRNPQNRSIEALISQITEAGQTDEQQSDFLVLMKTVWLQFATWQGDHAQCSRLIAETSFEGANIRPMTQCFFLRTCALFYLENEGNLNQAEAVQTEALNIGSSSGHSIVSVGNASRLGDISMQQGKLRQAELHYRAAMDASSQTDVADRTYQYQPLLGLAQLAYRQQRLDKALSYAEQVHRLPIYAETDITYPEFRLHLAAILATIHIANQTPENAFSFIHDISHFALSHPGWFILGGQLGLHFCKEKRCLYFLI